MIKSMDDLEELFVAIKEKAVEKGLRLVSVGAPVVSQAVYVGWTEEWTAYLDLANQVRASLLYIHAVPFDVKDQNTTTASELTFTEKRRLPLPDEVNELEWLSQWLMERTQEWEKYNQKISRIDCVWFKDGVGHRLAFEAPWYQAYNDAVDKVLEETESVEQENRIFRSKEEAVKVLRLAEQLARHERFPEATNDGKRLFMAEKLFPDESLDRRRVVQLAELIYWWEVEPTERATKAEKARALRESGENIRNIAAMLKMSEAKVRAALETNNVV